MIVAISATTCVKSSSKKTVDESTNIVRSRPMLQDKPFWKKNRFPLTTKHDFVRRS